MSLSLLAISLPLIGSTLEVGPPTWHGGVESIVRERCAQCHNPDGAAPFSLSTPTDFKSRRTFVAHVVEEGLMPPWLPSKGVPLRGSRALEKGERAMLLAWLEAGCPPGEQASSAPAPGSKAPSAEGLGEAPPESPSTGPQATSPVQADPDDLELSMRAPWAVPAEGGVRWFKAERDKRTFVLPVGNQRPLRIRALEYRSSAPQTLGAVALSADPTGDGRTVVDWDAEPGSYMMADIRSVPAGALGIIGPGGGRLDYPDGFYVSVPAGSDILSEVHYRPQGRERVLDDRLVLEQLAADTRGRPLVPINLMVPRVQLEPGQKTGFTASLTIPVDVDVVALSPRASRRCVSMQLEVVLPSSPDSIILLGIDDWNPHYRSTVVLEQPMRLPAGTIVRGSWRYDNSEGNPRNPVVPPESVDLGARSGAMNVLLMASPVDRIEIRPLLDFIEAEARRNRG